MDTKQNIQSVDYSTPKLQFKEFYESSLLNNSPFYIKLYNNLFCNACNSIPCFIKKENISFNLTTLFDSISIDDVYKGVQFDVILSNSKDSRKKIGVVFETTTEEQIRTKLRVIELNIKENKLTTLLQKFSLLSDYTDTFSTLHNFDYNKKGSLSKCVAPDFKHTS